MARFNRKSNNKPKPEMPSGGWQVGRDAARTNAHFERLYRTLIPEDEFETFMASCRETLPTTFRYVGAGAVPTARAARFLEEFVAHLADTPTEFTDPTNGNVVRIEPPQVLPWYPNNLGFQFSIPRFVLRKNEAFSALHRFIVMQHEAGMIARQEAVSMVPPLFLDVHPEHRVLDICAAPGSKTSQILEALSVCGPDKTTGFVIANDLGRDRCHVLARNLQPQCSPAYLVANVDATLFPAIADGDKPLKFDRILADVVCSGDGTIRKSPDLWRRYTSMDAVGTHLTQIKIAQRAAQLLKVGGRMVYSTCSMNPVENEASLAAILRWAGGALELLDVSAELPELIRRPGLHEWSIYDSRRTAFYDSYDSVPENLRANEAGIFSTGNPGNFRSSMFAQAPAAHTGPWATPEELHLERAMRFYPHLQNTGGFFVAVITKTAPVPGEVVAADPAPAVAALTEATAEANAAANGAATEDQVHAALMNVLRPRYPGWQDLPLRQLDDACPILAEIDKQLGIDIARAQQDGMVFLARTEDISNITENARIYVANKALASVLIGTKEIPGLAQQARLGVITAGLRAMAKNGTGITISQEGIQLLAPWLRTTSPARLAVPASLVCALLQATVEKNQKQVVSVRFSVLEELYPGIRDRIKAVNRGHIFLELEDTPDAAALAKIGGTVFCGFIGVDSLTLHIRHHLVPCLAHLMPPASEEVLSVIRRDVERYAAKAGAARPAEDDVEVADDE